MLNKVFIALSAVVVGLSAVTSWVDLAIRYKNLKKK